MAEKKETLQEVIARTVLSYHQSRSKTINDGQNIACVHCGSLDVKKNGKSGDKQRYYCNSCNKFFSV